MSATNSCETAILQLYFGNANHANIGDATGLRGSTTAGNYYVSLHTGNPGETGNQTTNECAYTSYARQAVARATGWSITGNTADNVAAIAFPTCTGGAETATHFGIGTDLSGVGNLLFYDVLAANVAISSGVTPNFPAGALDINLD